MKTPVTLQLLDELERFSLLYTCDACVHFGARLREERCGNGYPLGERGARLLQEGDEILFCKEFEAA